MELGSVAGEESRKKKSRKNKNESLWVHCHLVPMKGQVPFSLVQWGYLLK